MRRRLRFKGTFRVRTADGKNFRLYNNAFHLENHIFWLGIDKYPWERKNREIWTSLCARSGTILDIGANSGIYSVLAKVYNPSSRVIAFEPQPNVFRVLEKQNQVNGFDITCEQLALSDRAGLLPFFNFGKNTFTSENTTGGSLNPDWVTREQSSIEVEVIALKDYLEMKKIREVDLMKIDVETLEYEVLKGYGDLLERQLPVIILEIQNAGIGKTIKSLLPSGKYSLYNIQEPDGLREVQDLGINPDHLNYLLCPSLEKSLISQFIISEP